MMSVSITSKRQAPNAVLILLHGFTDSLESYLPLIPKLAALTHVYAIDFRGHGGSSHTPHDYTLRTHVDDIKRFIDMLIRAPVFVAGHSMGASVAAWLAALYPDTVRGLIIEDQDFDNPPDEKVPRFIPRRDQLAELKSSGTTIDEVAAIFATELTPEDQTKTRLDVYGQEGVQRHTRQWFEMDLTHFDSIIEGTLDTGWNGKEILSNITCPTLFITDNRWTNEEAVRQMQFSLSNIKNSRHVVIDVSNHRVHEMRPHEYLREVERFLQLLITH